MAAGGWSWMMSLGFLVSGVAGAQVLPARFEHDLVVLEVTVPDGAPLHFYTDSGGGWNMVKPEAARRLGLKRVGTLAQGGTEGEAPALLAANAALGTQIPLPLPAQDALLGGRLVEYAGPHAFAQDGFLGSRWFAGRRWLFDYPAATLSLWPRGWQPNARWRSTPMHFQAGSLGAPGLHFPRFTVQIDGQPLDMLLDTGAQATLGEDAARLHDVPVGTIVASSFVVRTTFMQWHARHPDWRVAVKGDASFGQPFPMIEVPSVRIAGIDVGPVWFAMREDADFHDMMSSMMDRQVEGAVGGSAFRYLRMALDYPGGMAWFQLPDASAAAAP